MSIHGGGAVSKYKAYFIKEMAKEFPRCLVGFIYVLVCRCFLSNCRFLTFQNEVQSPWYCDFLDYKSTKLEIGSQETRYYKILCETVFCKVFCTSARMLRGHEAFSFHFL